MGLFGGKNKGGGPTDMTPQKMAEIVMSLDRNAQNEGNQFVFEVEGRQLIIVFDPYADRMRCMSPVMQLDQVPDEIHLRMLQANFDSVLDCRYAVANDLIWSAFLHPFRSLTEEDLHSAISQVRTAAETFGTTFSSGALMFRGGDTEQMNESGELDRKPPEVH